MLNLSNYLNSGFGCVFIETTEIKRATNDISVNKPFVKLTWNILQGLKVNNDIREYNQLEVLEEIKVLKQVAVVLENYDIYLENPMVQQSILNNYSEYKNNQICLIIVGFDPKKIPPTLKELIPVIQFDLPSKTDISIISEALARDAKEAYKAQIGPDVLDRFDVSDEIIEACQGLSYEEIENTLALSILEHNRFDIRSILERKRQTIRATGFMDFGEAEPVENLGGLDNLKTYVQKRKQAFYPDSNKPKLKSILLVGVQGCGKSLACKTIASIFKWPLITLDIGSLKGSLVGDTERNTRIACKTIDAFGKAIVQLEEIEKALAGSTGQNLDSGVSAGMLGYMLTWMQERKSESILIATANDISKLPPEFLRAGRWDCIFFVDTPNCREIADIICIMNKKYNSTIPINKSFCEKLEKEQWTGAEIEQLAKDLHFDSLEIAMENIPRIACFKKAELQDIREKARQFRMANEKEEIPRSRNGIPKRQETTRKMNLKMN